jgi:hypothetical protein
MSWVVSATPVKALPPNRSPVASLDAAGGEQDQHREQRTPQQTPSHRVTGTFSAMGSPGMTTSTVVASGDRGG